MALSNPHNQYRQNQVTTATPGELTLMLYDGAARFIRQSKQLIIDGNVEKSHESNLRSQDIIQELMVTLNMDIEISHQLMSLYDYINRRLIEANIKKDTEILDEVLGMVIDLRQTWSEVVRKVRVSQHPVGSLS